MSTLYVLMTNQTHLRIDIMANIDHHVCDITKPQNIDELRAANISVVTIGWMCTQEQVSNIAPQFWLYHFSD